MDIRRHILAALVVTVQLGAGPVSAAASDICLWTYDRGRRVELGTTAEVNNAFAPHGGSCYVSRRHDSILVRCETPGTEGDRLEIVGAPKGESCAQIFTLRHNGRVVAATGLQDVLQRLRARQR